MVIKVPPLEFKSFIAVITQRGSIKFSEFKVALRNFEDTDKIRAQESPVMGATPDAISTKAMVQELPQPHSRHQLLPQNFHKDFNSAEHVIELADDTRLKRTAEWQGDAIVHFKDVKGQKYIITLKNAIYVPSFTQNILSVPAATDNGASIIFNSHPHLEAEGKSFPLDRRGNLYFLNLCSSPDPEVAAYSPDEWHQVLGHCNASDIIKLEKTVKGMRITDPRSDVNCEVCIKSKMTQTINKKPDQRATSK
ncbi:CCHC-type zinc finger, nucleic acid binding protein a [Elysia marginata]|uniref:CCHC-type zinc finger, nucleic acid binding protein a n=1 Tax=Elysia marginata TaxID=1093978 RepID=A0AAV4GBS9_9GAST|nr:CCHC-type zinc finger, nucleic acid binding protein a [Elysia marginata]